MQILNHKHFCKALLSTKSITFTNHPGYLFTAKKNFARLFLIVKKYGLVQPSKMYKSSPLFEGTWETNEISTAFVQPINHTIYVHGEFWGGPTAEVLAMTQESSKSIKVDLDKDYVAIWHDESHLNNYSAKRKYRNSYFSMYFSGANQLTSKPCRSVIWSVKKKLI